MDNNLKIVSINKRLNWEFNHRNIYERDTIYVWEITGVGVLDMRYAAVWIVIERCASYYRIRLQLTIVDIIVYRISQTDIYITWIQLQANELLDYVHWAQFSPHMCIYAT